MSEPTGAPYALLTPDRVLDAVGSVGFIGDGRLLSLNSYENRVYQIWLEESRTGVPSAPAVVAKFYRPARWTDAQIMEEHAFVAELAAQPRDSRGRMALPSLRSAADVARIRRFSLRGLSQMRRPRARTRGPRHAGVDGRASSGACTRVGATAGPCANDPAHRPRQAVGDEPRDWLLAHRFIPDDLIEAWTSVAVSPGACSDGARRCYERAGDEYRTLRLHGDCHAGNVLWADSGPSFVDFDDSRMGPAIQDLWMLLSGDARDMAQQCRAVLSGYEDFADFDDAWRSAS